MTYRIITLWKLNKVTVEKISVCDSEVGAWVTCKISIWFRASPDHELIICRNWKTRDKRKMLVKVTFVQVRVLLLLGS